MEIYKKISAIMADVEAVPKDRNNTQQNYKFRGIDDCYNSLHYIFAKHEVFITSEVLEQKREEKQTAKGGTLFYVILTIKFTFFASDGSFISSTMIGEAMDSGDKATNKAMSVALKYALMQLLLIPTNDEKDPEKTIIPEIIKKKELPEYIFNLIIERINSLDHEGATELASKHKLDMSKEQAQILAKGLNSIKNLPKN